MSFTSGLGRWGTDHVVFGVRWKTGLDRSAEYDYMLYMRKHSDGPKTFMRQLESCPSCGARIAPTPSEILRLRTLARLTQREMAKLLGVKGSHVAYLENDRRRPSGTLILRYRKVEKLLLANIKTDSAVRLKFVASRQSANRAQPTGVANS